MKQCKNNQITMLKKGNKFYSILFGKCPKCHNESMYQNKNPYQLLDTLKMHDHCSYCGTKYKIEPSFFYGSMYVSYAVGIVFALISFIISKIFLGSTLKVSFTFIVFTLIGFMPIIMRVSRNIWINIFMSYDPNLDS